MCCVQRSRLPGSSIDWPDSKFRFRRQSLARPLAPDERPIPVELNRYIDEYLRQSRTVLIGSEQPTNALWISSTTGWRMTTKNLGTLVSKIALGTLGVDVSPHLFRTGAASTAAAYSGVTPPSRPRLAEPHGPTRDGAALQSSKQRDREQDLR